MTFKMTYICECLIIMFYNTNFMKVLQVLFLSFINFCVLTFNNIAASVDDLTKGLQDVPTTQNLQTFEEILNVLLSLIGGILSSVILTILHKKFPKLFDKSKFLEKRFRKKSKIDELN